MTQLIRQNLLWHNSSISQSLLKITLLLYEAELHLNKYVRATLSKPPTASLSTLNHHIARTQCKILGTMSILLWYHPVLVPSSMTSSDASPSSIPESLLSRPREAPIDKPTMFSISPSQYYVRRMLQWVHYVQVAHHRVAGDCCIRNPECAVISTSTIFNIPVSFLIPISKEWTAF